MTKRPNIILLVMDSVRVANMSCYGYHRATTPHIDALAEQGALFKKAFSVGCWTLPVHASLFTGLYPFNHSMTVSKDALPDDFPTLAYQLKELGYQTASFSNNAYVSEVTRLTQGFDTVEDVWQVSNPRGTKRTKLSRLIKRLESLGPVAAPAISLVRRVQQARSIMKRRRPKKGDKGAKLTNEKIKAWLSQNRDPDKPFFIFVNYMEPHEPYGPPHPFDRRFMPKRFSAGRVARVANDKDAILSGPPKRRRDDLEILRALYDGELSYLDQKIGELVQFIESLDLLDETIVVVTSDHGDSLGEHEHLGHRMSLYEQLVHVPLVIRYPARFRPGAQVDELVSLIDLYPTFLELAGADLSQVNVNGFYSLTAVPGAEKRPFLIAENTAPKSLDSTVSRMVRTDRYKYIWKSDQQHELYDLDKDPDELVNLYAAEPEIARRLNEWLTEWQQSLEGGVLETDTAEYDEAIQDRLRELGYVE